MSRPSEIPGNFDTTDEDLNYFSVEVSYGGTWVDINDHTRYIVEGSTTRAQSQKTWRKITATSPVLGGSYLVHAVPDMISEQVAIYVYGESQTDLADNFFFLDQLFEQPSFQIRWTLNEYREYWDCQLADAAYTRSQVLTHSTMAMTTYTVARFPRVTRERI